MTSKPKNPKSLALCVIGLKISLKLPIFKSMGQGNLYTGGWLLYRLCSHQPTVELAVGKYFFPVVNNLTTKPIVG